MLDFPVLLSAEWGQVPQLLDLIENTLITLQRRKKIISLLGEIQAKPAIPYLINLLTNLALQLVSTQALGNFGTPMQQPLIAILKTHPDINMQAATAQSLGVVERQAEIQALPPFTSHS